MHTLSDDIHLLGDCLGHVIRRLAGDSAFQLEEAVRAAAKALRAQPSLEDARRLRDKLDQLDLPALRMLIRAFTLYFDLVNLAEQQERVRVLRKRAIRHHPLPTPESIDDAVFQLHEQGLPAERLDAYLQQAMIWPVLTAHPTEARRRTVLEKIRRIAQQLDKLELTALAPDEREAVATIIAEEIETLWVTDLVRPARPSVLDEVRQGLGLVGDTLFEVIPMLYRSLGSTLDRYYPDHPWHVPAFLRFGSWIGGDRDGNPNVTPPITVEALRVQQERILLHHLDRVRDLEHKLSHSALRFPVTPELADALYRQLRLLPEHGAPPEREPYRRFCRVIHVKLERTLAFARSVQPRWGGDEVVVPEGVYHTWRELHEDLQIMAHSLHDKGAILAARGALQDLIRQVEVFGIHMMTLDIRQHGARHRSALAEILQLTEVCSNYQELGSSERRDLLARILEEPRPLIPLDAPWTPATRESIETLRTIAAVLDQQCGDAIRTYIISMTADAAHLLEVLVLAKEAGLFRPKEGISKLHLVPLFETLEALREAPEIMRGLFELPIYRRHLELRGNVQEIMIGYSDSNKESGYLQSVWALYQVERKLVEVGRHAGIKIQIFHGRGGAIGRGGGPTNRAILTQPRGTMEGRIRLTEQGEVIAEHYAHTAIAERYLEQTVHAVFLASFPDENSRFDPAWERILDRLAEDSRRHYRALVYETPEFLAFFPEATPIEEISQFRIGSRPARRGSVAGIEDLRAIPWVFSWMQSRYTLPGWYGLGSALERFLSEEPDGLAQLQTMYEEWPFWRRVIGNVQMILAKADMTIARLYADLVEDQEMAGRMFERIAEEYRRTARLSCQVAKQEALLDDVPILQHSIQRRNPYVDPLSFIQLVLLKRLRSGEAPREELMTAVLESINGIAAGLKNTG